MLSVSEQRDIHGHAAALSNAKVNKQTHNICTDITVAPKWSESTHTTMTLLRLFTLRFSHFFPPHPMEMCACWLWALCHLLSNREHFRIFHKHNMNWSDGSVRSAKKQIICNIFIRNSHICNEYQWHNIFIAIVFCVVASIDLNIVFKCIFRHIFHRVISFEFWLQPKRKTNTKIGNSIAFRVIGKFPLNKLQKRTQHTKLTLCECKTSSTNISGTFKLCSQKIRLPFD